MNRQGRGVAASWNHCASYRCVRQCVGLAVVAALLLAPTASHAKSGDGPPAPFLFAVAGTTAVVTTVVAPLICNAADNSGRYPLLQGFVYAALGSILGAGLGVGISYALNNVNIMSVIGIPMLLGTAGALWVSVGGLTGHAKAEDLDATRDRAWSVIPSQVALVPLPSGLATVVAWRF